MANPLRWLRQKKHDRLLGKIKQKQKEHDVLLAKPIKTDRDNKEIKKLEEGIIKMGKIALKNEKKFSLKGGKLEDNDNQEQPNNPQEQGFQQTQQPMNENPFEQNTTTFNKQTQEDNTEADRMLQMEMERMRQAQQENDFNKQREEQLRAFQAQQQAQQQAPPQQPNRAQEAERKMQEEYARREALMKQQMEEQRRLEAEQAANIPPQEQRQPEAEFDEDELPDVLPMKIALTNGTVLPIQIRGEDLPAITKDIDAAIDDNTTFRIGNRVLNGTHILFYEIGGN